MRAARAAELEERAIEEINYMKTEVRVLDYPYDLPPESGGTKAALVASNQQSFSLYDVPTLLTGDHGSRLVGCRLFFVPGKGYGPFPLAGGERCSGMEEKVRKQVFANFWGKF